MKQMVSFEKVKLTNNELDQHGHVSVLSFYLSFVWTDKNTTDEEILRQCFLTLKIANVALS